MTKKIQMVKVLSVKAHHCGWKVAASQSKRRADSGTNSEASNLQRGVKRRHIGWKMTLRCSEPNVMFLTPRTK
jgi:hypothetical protein